MTTATSHRDKDGLHFFVPTEIRNLNDWFAARHPEPVTDSDPASGKSTEFLADCLAELSYERFDDGVTLMATWQLYCVILGILAERRRAGDVEAALALTLSPMGKMA